MRSWPARAQVGNRVAIWTCSDLCRYTCGVKLAPVEGDPTNINSHYSDACHAGYGAVDTAEDLASQGNLVSIVTERETSCREWGLLRGLIS